MSKSTAAIVLSWIYRFMWCCQIFSFALVSFSFTLHLCLSVCLSLFIFFSCFLSLPLYFFLPLLYPLPSPLFLWFFSSPWLPNRFFPGNQGKIYDNHSKHFCFPYTLIPKGQRVLPMSSARRKLLGWTLTFQLGSPVHCFTSCFPSGGSVGLLLTMTAHFRFFVVSPTWASRSQGGIFQKKDGCCYWNVEWERCKADRTISLILWKKEVRYFINVK